METGCEAAFTWLGHAAFRVDTGGGRVILIDPWLRGNPACPAHLQEVDRCDIILATHAHSDHIGDVVRIAGETGATVVAMVELAGWFGRQGLRSVIGMNKGGTVRIGDVTVAMVHANHSSSVSEHEGSSAGPGYAGEPAGFVVTLEDGYTFYHAGDTNVFADMSLIGEIYAPRLAMLPIGDFYTMGPREAAVAVRLLAAPHVIPMHYGTFPVLTGTPAELRELTSQSRIATIHEMKPGDTLRQAQAGS